MDPSFARIAAKGSTVFVAEQTQGRWLPRGFAAVQLDAKGGGEAIGVRLILM